ncbi:methyltransferase domain-containing protein [Ditylenchus destructor]|uniref:Methyltransferase domain-containing protein n=1 Tax=Ditylenchus destructor TaxID=166010 RepID=A0AAD4R4M3_9BILA|nr:methyltransferase domain-containing protein [Ditylenchus destructor]
MTLRRSAIPISMVYRCYASNSSSNQGQTSTSVDPRNLARFDELSTTASEWMNEKTGAFRALHSFNKLRVPWIAGQLTKNKSVDKPLEGVRIVDVGSGGGLLSMALCRLGADVTGVDASTSTKRVAELTAQRTLKPEQLARLRFVNSTVESFAAENTGGFDAVVASEILEHVSDLPAEFSQFGWQRMYFPSYRAVFMIGIISSNPANCGKHYLAKIVDMWESRLE